MFRRIPATVLLPVPRRAALVLLAVMLLLAVPPPAQAQRAAESPEQSGYVHERWTVAEGLPVNSVNALLQDRAGYLWIATFDGLVRFDGAGFTVFNTGNSEGLPSNRILELVEARDGSLWLLAEPWQLVRFRDGRFTHFDAGRGLSHNVYSFREDATGVLWVGTDRGLGYIDGERFVPVAPETLTGVVEVLLRRRDGSVVAGMRGSGLVRVARGRASVVEPGSALAAEGVTALHEEADGTLWIGTGAGVWRLRETLRWMGPAVGVIHFHTPPDGNGPWLLANSGVYRLDGGVPVRIDDVPRTRRSPWSILSDSTGHVLYGTGAEIHRGGERLYALAPAEGPAAAASTVHALLFDHEGSLWIGTAAAGLHRLKPAAFTVFSEAEGLGSRNVYSVLEDRDGAVWVGTWGGGLARLADGRLARLAPEQGRPRVVLAMLLDRAGRLWIGGWGALVCSAPEVRCAPPAGDPLGDAPVRAFFEDTDGAVWVGSDYGLWRHHEGRWRRFAEADGAPAAPVRAFLRTADGALWMATNGGGIARYHDGRFRHVTVAEGLPFDLVRSLHQDADGWLWVGTEGRGLARLDPREWAPGRAGGRIVSYRVRDGLFDEVIHQILEDDHGRLWMSTNRGIFRVERAELLAFAEGRIVRIRSTGYTERDGLRNREANGGSQPAGVRTRDGRLWFATQDGVVAVDPARVEGNRIPPNVVIERVRAGGAELPAALAGLLELGVEQRDLEIDYTALSLLAPGNVRFRYRLEGYDAEWVDAGNRRTAFYTRVPPGRYRFRVIASNNDGVWNEAGAALELHLRPRFRETGAFRVLLLLAATLLLAGGIGWRARRARADARELERLVYERTADLQREKELTARQAAVLAELDRAKSRFFANLSHEFRTPLTLILGPLRDLVERGDGALPASVREQHQMMLRNARRLMRLINQVLDLARLEGGVLRLQVEPRELVPWVREHVRGFAALAEQRRIALAFEARAEAERIRVAVDAEQMEKVVLNLLSNAFKFTDPEGTIRVSVRQESERAVIEVRDTGIGIAPGELPRVFDRFYQADTSNTRRREGTGIGLSLARELVELHGGTVTVESQPGQGSVFRVHLPLLPAGAPAAPEPAVGASSWVPLAEPLRLREREDVVSRLREEYELEAGAPALEETAEGSGADDTDHTTVLVVDDNADVRAYVRSVLETEYRVVEAADGSQGLERARATLPDVIVADVMMPKLDGFGLVRALREDPATGCIPVILLTARAEVGDEVEGLGAGADDYIVKPFHAGALLARVAGLIAMRRRLRERFRAEGFPPPAESDAVAEEQAPEPASPERRRLRAIVEANLTDPNFGPEALAEGAGLSYWRLRRRLAEEFEMTPTQFIRTVRVERAADLLRDGAGSVTEVAYSVGFQSLSYFHRCFRERFGDAPTVALRETN